jgi:hypothetical protein
MRPAATLLLLLACSSAAPRAAAEQCQMGWNLSLDVPRDGATIRPGARFRILEYMGCSSIDGGPRHELRLLDAAGAEIAVDPLPYGRDYIELTPKAPLSPGAAALWVRRPATKDTLGPWEPLSRVTVAGDADTSPPVFDGIVWGDARPIEGTVALSPCQAVPGWELQSRLRFPKAVDAESEHDELLYRLQRAPPSSEQWEDVTTLRPSPDGDRMAFEWRSESGWSETFRYRMSVRDMGGLETTGARLVTIANPARPARELWSPESERDLLTPDPSHCACGIPGSSGRGLPAGGAFRRGFASAGAALAALAALLLRAAWGARSPVLSARCRDQEGPHRQPRGDRCPDPPHPARAGHPGRRGL